MAESNIETFDFPQVEVGFFLSRLEESMRTSMAKMEAEKEAYSKLTPEQQKVYQWQEIPRPMLAIGKAGIGKTEGVRGVARELGIGMKEMRLVNYTETDLIGIPYLKDGRTLHGTNDLFPVEERDGEYGFLLVDEFTSASRNIQVPILQLTDSSRAIGNYKLPKGWKIIIAGNGPNDGGTFVNLPGTVISRSSCYYVQASSDSWLSWAAKNNIHPAIRAFIKSNPNEIHGYNEDYDTGYDRAFPCPRAWTNLSTELYDIDNRTPDWAKSEDSFAANSYTVSVLVSSYIGTVASDKFMNFLRYESKLIEPNLIIMGKPNLPKLASMEAPVAYFQLSILNDALSNIFKNPNTDILLQRKVDDRLLKAVANCFNWVLDSCSPESERAVYATTEFMDASAGIAPLIIQSPQFNALCPKFSKLGQNLAALFAPGVK